MKHKLQGLERSSEYIERHCPITRRALQAGDQVVICLPANQVYLADSFEEHLQHTQQCPGCAAHIGNSLSGLKPLEKPAWRVQQPQLYRSRRSPLRDFAVVALTIAITVMVLAALGLFRGVVPQLPVTDSTSPTVLIEGTAGTAGPPAPTQEEAPLFADDFAVASSGWDEFWSNGTDTNGYSDGAYAFNLIDASRTEAMVDVLPNLIFRDYNLGIDFSLVEGSGRVGMVIGFIETMDWNEASFYVVTVNSEGTLAVEFHRQGLVTPLAIDTSQASPAGGLTAGTHRLAITHTAGLLVVALDGVELGRVHDTKIREGRVGMYIEFGSEQGPMRVRFDNIRVDRVQ